MEEKLIAFISSRINDEMRQARQVVREAIEELPLTRAWLFEESPALTDELEESYLLWVGKCDLFILLLGEDITDPIWTEWETATQARKPRLVFLKKDAQNEETWAFAKGLNVKWKEYETLDQLKRQVQAAVGDELIRCYRAYGVIGLVGVQREREGQAIRRRVQGWLTALLETGALTAPERAAAGDVLARLGDPRFGPQALSLPREPLLGFIQVAPGPFWMGSRKGKEEWADELGHTAPVDIPYPYYVARYPVTVAQYAEFVAAGGYQEAGYWTPTGWAWRQGEYDSKAPDYLQDWLKQRPPERRDRPFW